MTATGLIPRKRLERIPRHLRLAHEYCFFLHDQCVHLLAQYEAASAHTVKIKFKNKAEAKRFAELAEDNAIDALRGTGYPEEARRVILNTITMAMVSDTLHHLFEGLKCLEKRKTVVALNLLRKPLTDNLIYLAWMLGDEDGFFEAFSSGDPARLSPSAVGNVRSVILQQALDQTKVASALSADFVREALFDRKNPHGLQGLFQHAVHLVTVQHIELRTSPENFNFIFKSHTDDDIYASVYEQLPDLMLYLSHVILELFERVEPMDHGAKTAFETRSMFGLYLVERSGTGQEVMDRLAKALTPVVSCGVCKTPVVITPHNASRIVLTESFRCTACRRVQPFPFAWLF